MFYKINSSVKEFKQILKHLLCYSIFYSVLLIIMPMRSTYADPDLPGHSANMELIPAGSLIIAMDNANQSGGAYPLINLKAYGLAHYLLENNIPLKWAITANKVKDGIDFSTSVTGVAGGATGGLKSFSAGPLIVHRKYAQTAMPYITSFGNNVKVYQTTAPQLVDIRYNLKFKPHVTVGATNSSIHTKVYADAGVSWTQLSSDLIPPGACHTFISQPHIGDTTVAYQNINSVRDFLQGGGNFLGQCHTVETYEISPEIKSTTYQNARFVTTNTLVVANNTSVLTYPRGDMAVMQFEGALNGAQGGSGMDWTFFGTNPPSTWNNNGHAHAWGTGLYTQAFQVASAKLKPAGTVGGHMTWLGGHDYAAQAGGGWRVLLNATLVPAERPAFCAQFLDLLEWTDAPSSYGNVAHDVYDDGVTPVLMLGTNFSLETGPYNDPNAAADSHDDGVVLPSMQQGQTVTIPVTISGQLSTYQPPGTPRLNAWIDWNGNGVFDPEEQIAIDVQDNGAGDTNPAIGQVALQVNVPADAVTTQTFARFRYTSQSGTILPNSGNAADGEVEDYALLIQPAPPADLKITKTDGVTEVQSGSDTTYIIRVTNLGPNPVTGAILKDPLVADLTKTAVECSAETGNICSTSTTPTIAQLESSTGYALPTLQNNEFYEIVLTVRVDALDGEVTNTVTVDIPVGMRDPDETNNTALDTNTVIPLADLVVDKTGPETLTRGDTVNYSITLWNKGSSPATSSHFVDNIPVSINNVNWVCTANGAASCGSVTNGTGNNIDITTGTLPVNLSNTPPTSGDYLTVSVSGIMNTEGAITNTATISEPGGAVDTDESNNTNDHTIQVRPLADLGISKQGPVELDQGAHITYTLTAWNNGPSTVNSSTINDIVPTQITDVTWHCIAHGSASCGITANGNGNTLQLNTGTLPVNNTGGVPTSGDYLTIVIDATASTSGTAVNTAMIATPTGTVDNNSLNDSSSVSTVIGRLITISGEVFNDNSGDTQNAAFGYNGIKDSGESGIPDITVRLTDCQGTTIDSTTTDDHGDYTFRIAQQLLPSPQFCVVETNLDNYRSTGGSRDGNNTAYNSTTDTITIDNTGGDSYPNNQFADVRISAWLTENGQQTTVAGSVMEYPHLLMTDSVVSIDQITVSATQQPANSNDQVWQNLLYRDNNCNGRVDQGETLLQSSLPFILYPANAVCLVQRVHVPTNASAGAQNIGQLQASYNAVLPNGTVNSQTNTVQDTTLIGSAALDMKKYVRQVDTCPSTATDTNPFMTNNQAQAGSFLEYEIRYRNNSTTNLQGIKLNDSIPVGTELQSMSCEVNPTGSCSPSQNGDALQWNIGGTLLPGREGAVRFCTRVP